jgi:transcriptional regulator with XRE-family HTH domain
MIEIMERIAELASRPTTPGELVVPRPELVAFNVRMTRAMLQLKVSALVAMAGVSVSTIERVERAEKVSNEALDRIAVALGEVPGYFSAPRALRSAEEMAGALDGLANSVAVAVAPLRKEYQVRRLAHCHGFVVSRPYLGTEFDEDIAGLVEWIDLTGFVLSSRHPDYEGGRRDLYTSVLRAVEALERRGVTILAGVMEETSGSGGWSTAIISVTPKDRDPGAIKGRTVLVDRNLSIGTRAATRSTH